jgi:hypothetical protein
MAAVMATAALWLVGPAHAQTRRPELVLGRKTLPAEESMLASTVDRDRIRTYLSAVHGTTRAALDAASADVPRLLREFIVDPGEPLFVRRQAIKALELYPDGENLAFIQARVPLAEVPLARLYLVALRSYAPTMAATVEAIATEQLAHPDATVRHAALGLARSLPVTTRLRATLESRLQAEPEPALRKDLHELLSAPARR